MGSTLTQVMACCLTAPSHYLNQCWLDVYALLRHSFESKFTVSAITAILYNELENQSFKITPTTPRVQWVEPFSTNIGIYSSIRLLYVSFLEVEKAWVNDILAQWRQGPVYPAWSIPWLLMTWQGARASAIMVFTSQNIPALAPEGLMHWGFNKMDVMLQMTFWNTLSWKNTGHH